MYNNLNPVNRVLFREALLILGALNSSKNGQKRRKVGKGNECMNNIDLGRQCPQQIVVLLSTVKSYGLSG